jgi:outer membrane protein TolC
MMKRHAKLLICIVIAAAAAGGCSSGAGRGAFDGLARVGTASGYAPENRKLPALGEAAGLGEYLRYAALNNPGLEAAFNRWKAALERVPQVTSLPDPRFTYKYYIEQVETRVGPQRHSVAASQTFPWFGKLKLRGDVALAAANAERARYEAAKLNLFYRVQDTYHELGYLGRAVAIERENRDLAKYIERVARKRYEGDVGTHHDVIRAQVELGKLEDRLSAVVELRGPITARLNAALNRPINAELPWPARPPLEEANATDEQILEWLGKASPELKALEHEIAKRRSAVDLAKKNYYPDITLGLTHIDTGNGRDPAIAMASINLPIWYAKYRAADREAEARLRAAVLQRTNKENLLGSTAKMALYRFRDAGRKINLYRDTLVPKAKQSLKATQAAYSSGKASFLDLIDAQRILLEFQLSYERSLANRAQRLAEIEALVGRKITDDVGEDR